MDGLYYIGLPMKTLFIVGGTFIVSALLPSIVALILKCKKVLDKDE
ncbi:hypothetical protein [Geosporobacter ferrireducens]|nr:hypothetical protein [Geosporobacter ferrireducens]